MVVHSTPPDIEQCSSTVAFTSQLFANVTERCPSPGKSVTVMVRISPEASVWVMRASQKLMSAHSASWPSLRSPISARSKEQSSPAGSQRPAAVQVSSPVQLPQLPPQPSLPQTRPLQLGTQLPPHSLESHAQSPQVPVSGPVASPERQVSLTPQKPQPARSVQLSHVAADAQGSALEVHSPAPSHTSPLSQLPQLPPQPSSPQERPAQLGVQLPHASLVHAQPSLHEPALGPLASPLVQRPLAAQKPQLASAVQAPHEAAPAQGSGATQAPLRSHSVPMSQLPQLPPHPLSPQVRPAQSGVHEAQSGSPEQLVGQMPSASSSQRQLGRAPAPSVQREPGSHVRVATRPSGEHTMDVRSPVHAAKALSVHAHAPNVPPAGAAKSAQPVPVGHTIVWLPSHERVTPSMQREMTQSSSGPGAGAHAARRASARRR